MKSVDAGPPGTKPLAAELAIDTDFTGRLSGGPAGTSCKTTLSDTA